jgi:hypothetical protein
MPCPWDSSLGKPTQLPHHFSPSISISESANPLCRRLRAIIIIKSQGPHSAMMTLDDLKAKLPSFKALLATKLDEPIATCEMLRPENYTSHR